MGCRGNCRVCGNERKRNAGSVTYNGGVCVREGVAVVAGQIQQNAPQRESESVT